MCVACATDWKNIIPIYSPVGYSPSQLYHCPQFTYGSSRPSGMKDVNLSTRNQVIASNLVRTLFCFKSSASLTENSIILSFVFTALARSQLFYYLFLYNFISQLNLQRPKDLSRTAFTQVLHQQNSSSTPWLGVKVSSSSFMFSYLWKGNRVAFQYARTTRLHAVDFLWTALKFRKRKKHSWSPNYVLHKTWN